jgi:heptosyltransferase-3
MGNFLKCDPRVRRVIEQRRGGGRYVVDAFMRYDSAFAINGSDRSAISIAAAGRRKRVGQVDPELPLAERWKQLVLTHPVVMPGGKPVIKWTVHLARAAGLCPTRCRATVHWTDNHRAAVHELLQDQGALNGHFVIHPCSRYPYKEWPIDRVAGLSDHLASTTGLRPIWTGSGSERDRATLAQAAIGTKHAPVLCAGSLDLNAVTCLIAQADLFVGVDTAVTHLAATTGTPVVAPYGPTPTRGWAPWNNDSSIDFDFPDEPGSFRNGHISVLQDADAFRREHTWTMDMQRASEGMAAITVDEVVSEAEYQWTHGSVHSPA